MRIRPATLVALLVLLASWSGLAVAADLDKEDKAWLDEVRPIMTADEAKTFSGLEDKADREEFRKIFWARRDPDLSTPENEYQPQFAAAREEADERFRVPGRMGSETDCGRTFLLLGEPDDTKVEGVASTSVLRRVPEVWIYKSKEGQTFDGGEARIAFDDLCRGVRGIQEKLDEIAAGKIRQPQLEYRTGEDGRLVSLEDQLPKPTPARVLLDNPRQDFPITVETHFMKVSDGVSGVVGLLRGEAPDLAVEKKDDARVTRVVVATKAVDADGAEVSWTQQPVWAEVQEDGSFVASYGTSLPPGPYTLSVGAVIGEEGPQGALVAEKVDVPDFSKVETGADGSTTKVATVASVLFVREIEELDPGADVDSEKAYASFRLGSTQFYPFFGRELSKSDTVTFFYMVYDLALKPGTEVADATVAFTLLKDGRTPIAKAPPNSITDPMGASSVGPVPMGGFPPGSYVAQLKVTDNVSKKVVVQNERFTLVDPDAAP